MKRTEVYKKIYKIGTSEDPEDRGEEYPRGSNDGKFIDALSEMCIEQERDFEDKMLPDYSFLLNTREALIKIDLTGSKFEKEYERRAIIQISPRNVKIPKELSDLLDNFGFKKSK